MLGGDPDLTHFSGGEDHGPFAGPYSSSALTISTLMVLAMLGISASDQVTDFAFSIASSIPPTI
ncbi:MAG: hypothetical protein Ct9H300mP16_01130 [Pseudomonadota bacterium]|nr:MAG: hypothetical protein Ct9H300mP16_01130 [Pseudomonadota bacterium]